MPDEHEDRGGRQRIDAGGAAAEGPPQAGQPDHERRPQDRRLRPHQNHVETGHKRHCDQRRPARYPRESRHHEQPPGEECHVQPGDREDVDRPCHHERFGGVAGKPLPGAENERGGKRGAGGGEMGGQCPLTARTQRVEKAPNGQAGRSSDFLEALGAANADDRQRPLLAGAGPFVEFARIPRRHRTRTPAPHQHARVHGTRRRRPVDHKHRPAAGPAPGLAIPDRRHLEEALARRRKAAPPEWISGARAFPRGVEEPALDDDRLRPVAEHPGQIVGGKQAPPCRRPSRPGQRHRGEQDRPRRRMATAGKEAPRHKCHHRRRPACRSHERHGEPEQRPHGQRDSHDDQRAGRERPTTAPSLRKRRQPGHGPIAIPAQPCGCLPDGVHVWRHPQGLPGRGSRGGRHPASP